MEDRPKIGDADTVAPGIRRVLAPNPSPMTHWGTNSYILGGSRVAVVDPGPDDPNHLNALLTAIGSAEVACILITHAHRDHTELVPAFVERVNAPVYAFGPPEAGRSDAMDRLARSGRAGGGEGVDRDFRPDQTLADGDVIALGEMQITAHHTPGHFPGHLCFGIGDVLLSGDHVMGWSTTLISPPEGDVSSFIGSCETLLTLDHAVYLPGHGAPIADPHPHMVAQVKHRKHRESQILATLEDKPGTPDEIARRIYKDLAPTLLPAAARNVLAHLVDLTERGLAEPRPTLAWDAEFFRS